MSLRRQIQLISALAIGMVSPAWSEDPPVEEAHSKDVSVSTKDDLRERAVAAAKANQDAESADPEITLRAEEAAGAVHSEGFRALMNEMSANVLQTLGVEDEANKALFDRHEQLQWVAPLSPIVFVSSSIPLTTLRAYAAQAEKIDAVLVIRGGVGGLKSMGPTVDFIMDVLRVDSQCNGVDCDMLEVSVLIDPILFNQAGIDRVPAVAVVHEDPFISYCERKTANARADPWVLTYGDASLSAHLDELRRLGQLSIQEFREFERRLAG